MSGGKLYRKRDEVAYRWRDAATAAIQSTAFCVKSTSGPPTKRPLLPYKMALRQFIAKSVAPSRAFSSTWWKHVEMGPKDPSTHRLSSMSDF